MAFCKNCGTEIPDGTTVCPKCKEETAKIPMGSDRTAEFDPADIEKNKTLSGLAYILFFLPLVACPDSKFGRFHANQSLLLVLACLAAGVINIIPILGWIISLVAYLVIGVFAVIGLINGFQGKAKELPLIGKIMIIK